MSRAAGYIASARMAGALSGLSEVVASHSTLDRNALIEAHLPQVRIIAERLLARLPPSVDRDDLIGAGVLGLLDAVSRFDPVRGVVFRTYAEARIRGAMLDSLRNLDWAPRTLRQRARELETATRRLEQALGRAAEAEEICAEMQMPVAEYLTLLQDLRGLSVAELESEDDEQIREIPDDPEQLPLARYEREEIRDRLCAAIDHLPPRERQVIALYYHEELTMKEVGAVMGLTESRVSQIHTQAVIRLRGALRT